MESRFIPALLLTLLAAGCSPGPGWNVLVVTLDTTRADRLGCYGNASIRTPVLDGLAAAGVLFEQAISPAPITLPAHSSIMTGKVPFAHGVRDNGLFALGDEQVTLAEVLRRNGYRTGAAIGAFPLISRYGLGQGFEHFDDHVTASYEDLWGERVFPKQRLYFDERRAARVNEALLPWLEEHHREPFFAWLHYFDPHHPHEPPPPYDQLYAHDLYDGEIAYADESLGTVLDHLRRLGVYDDTLIIVTADHGEGLGEHNEATHSMLVYDSTLHVPLIVKAPGGPSGARVAQRVGTIDVLPTVLDLLGIAPPETVQGHSLRPWLEAGPDPAGVQRREIYAETLSPRISRNWGEQRALYLEDYKYIHGPRRELYRLTDDPRELENLADRQPQVAEGLRRRLERYLAEHAVPGLDSSVAVDDDEARRLQALGYLQVSGGRLGPIEEALSDEGAPPQDHVENVNLYSEAKSKLFRGRLAEGRELVLDLLARDPQNPHYLELRLGRHREALAALDRMAASGAGYPPPEKLLATTAQVLLAQGRLEEALQKLRQSQAIEETAAGQYTVAKIHQALGQGGDELRSLERALELDPAHLLARIDLGIRRAQNGDLEGAETHFRRALADNPYSERAFYNFGTFLVQRRRHREALAYFRRAAELQPAYPQALYALVELHWQLGESAEALASFETLDRLAPDSHEAKTARRLLEADS